MSYLTRATAVLFFILTLCPTADAREGDVRFFKVANTQFDPYIENPNAEQRQWMLDHYDRMKGWSPRFDQELHWYVRGWFYKDAYGIKPDWAVFAEHPEWILRDTAGNMLYVPFACSGGTCPQFAADFGNPDFRAFWIAEAQDVMGRGYQGVWIDDVNMTWRVSDGNANPVTPFDPRTGAPMLLDDWRRYMAEFMEEARVALSASEIAHNMIWYAGPEDNSNPFITRQIDAADFINLERGVTDLGLTGGNGRFALTTFLEFIDYLHGRGKNVILLDEALSTTQRQYALAGWLAINDGNDLMASENNSWTSPDSWWPGYDVTLGNALGPRYEWQTLIRRDFECGLILMNPPDRPGVPVAFGQSYSTIDGATVSAMTLAGDQSAVLLDACATAPADADADGVVDDADNCLEVANPAQRDTNGDGFGNLCDPDLNGDGVVNATDLALLRGAFFSALDPDADFDGDGLVNALDLGILRSYFFDVPGPSGIAP